MNEVSELNETTVQRYVDILTCEIAGFTEEKLIKYEKEMYDEKRRNSEMNTARRIGYENGLKAGMRDSHAEGRAEAQPVEFVFYSPASILSARAGHADL